MKALFLATLILFSLPSPTFAALDCKQEETFPIVSNAELNKIVKEQSAVIVDVNSEKMFKEKKVDGAIHFTTPEALLKQLPADKNKTIVAYCGGPQCTAWYKAAKVACNAGYTHIFHFKDGISGWKKL